MEQIDYIIIRTWQENGEECWELVDNCIELETALFEKEKYNNWDKEYKYEVYKKVISDD
jgi:hypothetical protein